MPFLIHKPIKHTHIDPATAAIPKIIPDPSSQILTIDTSSKRLENI